MCWSRATPSLDCKPSAAYATLQAAPGRSNDMQVDARKWYLSKLAPKRHGDRLQFDGDVTVQVGLADRLADRPARHKELPTEWTVRMWMVAPGHQATHKGVRSVFCSRLDGMGILEVLTAPRSPWQNAYVERVIGSVRRECLDHVIVLNARHLQQILSSYFDYYHRSRTHLSLAKDCPEPRPACPLGKGRIVAFPQVGGLHHRYERLAA